MLTKLARRIEQSARIHRLLARCVAPQIVQETRSWRRPSLADEIDFLGADAGEIEASPNRQGRETRIVLHAAQTLFRHRKQNFAVAHDARGRIVHLRIVDSESKH